MISPIHKIYTEKATSGKAKTDTILKETFPCDEATPTASSHHIKTKSEELDLENGSSEPDAKQEEPPKDPNIVDWDGPDDPENPFNWTVKKKLGATMSIALITLLTYGYLLVVLQKRC